MLAQCVYFALLLNLLCRLACEKKSLICYALQMCYIRHICWICVVGTVNLVTKGSNSLADLINIFSSEATMDN
jgi:hypothetical protein